MPKKSEGKWVTIRGQHILIGGDGTIKSGSMKGKNINDLSSSKSSGKKSSSKKTSKSKTTSNKKSESESIGGTGRMSDDIAYTAWVMQQASKAGVAHPASIMARSTGRRTSPNRSRTSRR